VGRPGPKMNRKPEDLVIALSSSVISDLEIGKKTNCVRRLLSPFLIWRGGFFFNFSDGGEYLKNTKDTKIFKGDKV